MLLRRHEAIRQLNVTKQEDIEPKAKKKVSKDAADDKTSLKD